MLKKQISAEFSKKDFKEEIPEEMASYKYLCEYNFEKHLKFLNKKLKNKKIIIYGAGIFFETIYKYFDLTGLNIIGIADKKFEDHEENQTFLGYKVYSPSEIQEVSPDYLLVATKFYINLIEFLYYNVLINTKIKIKPLVKKPFMTLLKEIWE